GNWDLGGVFLSAREVPISAVVEPIPRGWTATVNRYRGALAMETIPIPDHRAIGRALERRRLLVLVADRDLTGRGIVLPAFGARRSYPRGPAVYALRYGTPVVVGCFVSQDRPGRPPYVATVEPPIEFTPSGDFDTDVPALTGIIARRLNALIARYPDQWLVFNAGWQ
ncbi:lysophospholipid acyltransferase family protein, partial [candidate division WOR-3 bacterium]|nr:lysophospholipid acyltransferase family protein [candidate division WOR-3 bacterium]